MTQPSPPVVKPETAEPKFKVMDYRQPQPVVGTPTQEFKQSRLLDLIKQEEERWCVVHIVVYVGLQYGSDYAE